MAYRIDADLDRYAPFDLFLSVMGLPDDFDIEVDEEAYDDEDYCGSAEADRWSDEYEYDELDFNLDPEEELAF